MIELEYISEIKRSIKFQVPDGLSIDLPDYMLTGIEGIHGLAANIYDYAQYMQQGTTYVGSQLQARVIRITGKINNNVIPNRIALLETMNPLHTGTLILRRGEFERKIMCVIEQAPFFPGDNGWIFSVILRCPSPYWTEMSEHRHEIAYWEPEFEWELDIPIQTEYEGVIFGTRTILNIINVYNESDSEIGMRITMHALGTVINPMLIDARDERRFIRVNMTMLPGDRIEISTERREMYARLIREDMVTNIFGLMDPKSTLDMQLAQRDNVLRFDADEGRTLVDVIIFYTRQYMGV